MAKRMTRMAAAAATVLIPLIVSGCSTSNSKSRSSQSDADLSARTAGGSAQVQRFNVKDWSAPNDHTVVLITNDGTRYRAETLGPCMGLDFAHSLAFVNRGGFNQIDRFSSVVLADGTRCPFQTFDKLVPPESKALDDYEKAGEKPPQGASGKDKDDSKPK
jgi:hypothetical protein